MAKHTLFRVGNVRADLRSKVWYLTYFEDDQSLSDGDKTSPELLGQGSCASNHVALPGTARRRVRPPFAHD